MSLIRAGQTTRRLVGTAFLALLAGTVAFSLYASGRTLGRGVHFQVLLASPGALHGDAHLRLAGREVGEVRAIYRRPRGPDGAPPLVVVDCFVAAAAAPQIRRNSEIFVATPSILGEAYLEVGPTRGPAGPGITDGDTLRGVDPPVLDQFVARVYGSLTEMALLARQQRPTTDELLRGLDGLLTTLSGIDVEKGQLTRIRDHVLRAVDDGLAILHAATDTRAAPRLRTLARELGQIADQLAPELSALQTRLQAALARLDHWSEALPPPRREQAAAAFAALARAATLGESLALEVRRLAARIDRGEGTVGAFVADRELYEEFHEVHRILKNQPWTLIVKPEAQRR